MKKGWVYLVGAGPGDERLMTLRGLALIKEADVIVYDRLGAEGFLHFAKQDCQLIDAGKQPGHHSIKQNAINSLLCQLAKEDKRVLRLKGGDPFLFGRGGEEALILQERGIPFEVVPGVSSFYAACAYGGIPVTHRHVSSSIHVFTGHGAQQRDLDFHTIAKLSGTLVFLMAMGNLEYITKELLAQGKNPQIAAAIIEWGTTDKQRELVGKLENIALLAKQEGFANPAIVVIGEVAALGKEMNWQKYRPLWGKRILLAGRQETTKEAADFLSEEGASVTVWSGADSKILESEELGQALQNIHQYTWLFFSSAMGVAAFFKAMENEKMDSRKLAGLQFFCIGEKTKKALEEKGLYADYVPRAGNSQAAAKEMSEFLKSSDSLLFPASQLADSHLENEAKALGIAFHRVTAYHTTVAKTQQELPLALTKAFDAIGFFSPSQVEGLFNTMNGNFKGASLFSIGGTSKQALLARGQTVEAECKVSMGISLAMTILENLSNNFGGKYGL